MAGTRQTFIETQVRVLEPFDFVVIAMSELPFAAVEVSREEDGHLEVGLSGRPPMAPYSPEQLDAIHRLGFSAKDDSWVLPSAPAGPEAAAATVEQVLTQVFSGAEAAAVDVSHGSRRPEHEAQVKLAALRKRIEPILTELLGGPPIQDADGDYVFNHETTQVFVAPRAAPGVPVVIRVFAITNIGVSITPELGLFLARLNFGLMFGRFALDVDHRAVWFSETVLGEQVSDEEFRFTVGMVAETASEWDDRIAQMFGGYTRATMPTPEEGAAPTTKPGEGGYL